MRNPMRQRACLAGTGAGNHEEGLAWPSPRPFNAVLHGPALFRVQPFEVCREHRFRIAEAVLPLNQIPVLFARFSLIPCRTDTSQWGSGSVVF
jgi:hypothetical protein